MQCVGANTVKAYNIHFGFKITHSNYDEWSSL